MSNKNILVRNKLLSTYMNTVAKKVETIYDNDMSKLVNYNVSISEIVDLLQYSNNPWSIHNNNSQATFCFRRQLPTNNDGLPLTTNEICPFIEDKSLSSKIACSDNTYKTRCKFCFDMNSIIKVDKIIDNVVVDTFIYTIGNVHLLQYHNFFGYTDNLDQLRIHVERIEPEKIINFFDLVANKIRNVQINDDAIIKQNNISKTTIIDILKYFFGSSTYGTFSSDINEKCLNQHNYKCKFVKKFDKSTFLATDGNLSKMKCSKITKPVIINVTNNLTKNILNYSSLNYHLIKHHNYFGQNNDNVLIGIENIRLDVQTFINFFGLDFIKNWNVITKYKNDTNFFTPLGNVTFGYNIDISDTTNIKSFVVDEGCIETIPCYHKVAFILHNDSVVKKDLSATEICLFLDKFKIKNKHFNSE